MEPYRCPGSEAVTPGEPRSLVPRSRGDESLHQLTGERLRQLENGAVISAGQRVRIPVRFAWIEEEQVIGIGDEGLIPPGTAEDPSADQDDAVNRNRFLRSFLIVLVEPAPEIAHRYPKRIEQAVLALPGLRGNRRRHDWMITILAFGPVPGGKIGSGGSGAETLEKETR